MIYLKKPLRTLIAATAISATLLLSACNNATDTKKDAAQNSAPQQVQEKIDALVNESMAGSKATQAIVGVWLPDGTAYVRGYGDGTSANTPVLAAQQTAPAACALILELAKDGRIKLERKLSENTSRLKHAHEDVTYEQLCSGNSGLADYKPRLLNKVVETPARFWYENELLAEAYAHSPLAFPGQNYYLSDSDPLLALKAARHTTSTPVDKLYTEHVFARAQMNDSDYHNPRQPVNANSGMVGISYAGIIGAPVCEAEPKPIGPVSVSFLTGAGATVTTVTDLQKLYKALFAGKYGKSGDFEKLKQPHSLINPERDKDGKVTKEPQPVAEGALPHPETVLAAEKIGPLYGRAGWLPGSVGATYHDPQTGFTVSIQLNNSSVADTYARAAALTIAAELQDAGVSVPWTAAAAREQLNAGKICQG